jgi:hypothetical protein
MKNAAEGMEAEQQIKPCRHPHRHNAFKTLTTSGPLHRTGKGPAEEALMNASAIASPNRPWNLPRSDQEEQGVAKKIIFC